MAAVAELYAISQPVLLTAAINVKNKNYFPKCDPFFRLALRNARNI